jgi:hypothetical protein
MDTSSCSPGYATDRVMLCDPTIRCDANFIAYIVVLSVIIILRSIMVMTQYYQWNEREKRHVNNQRLGTTAIIKTRYLCGGKRQPITVYVGIMTVIFFIIFTVLTCTNIIGCGPNYYSSAPFYYLLFLPITTTNGIFMRRLARLGRALLPLARADLTVSAEREQTISKEDTILRVLTLLFFINTLGMALTWIIIAPIFAGISIPVTAGMACIGGIHLFGCSAYTWQLQRLIHLAQSSPARHNDGGKINTAIATLKLRQRFIILVGFSTGFVWFLCGIQIYSFNYVVVCVHIATDLLAVGGFMIRSTNRSAHKTSSSSGGGGAGGKNGNDNNKTTSLTSSVHNTTSKLGHVSVSSSNNHPTSILIGSQQGSSSKINNNNLGIINNSIGGGGMSEVNNGT